MGTQVKKKPIIHLATFEPGKAHMLCGYTGMYEGYCPVEYYNYAGYRNRLCPSCKEVLPVALLAL